MDALRDTLPLLVREGPWLGFTVTAAMMIAGGVLAAALLRTVRTRRAAARRRSLGPVKAGDGTGLATVEGVLEADGAVDRFGDGEACAVSVVRAGEAWACRRAGALAVVDGETRVPLEGPIDVVVGSYERAFSGSARQAPLVASQLEVADYQRGDFEARGVETRSVGVGERVRIRGLLVVEPSADEEAPDYRSAGQRRRLVPPGDEGAAITLAAVGVPTGPGARRAGAVGFTLGALLGLGAAVGGGALALESIPRDAEAPLAQPMPFTAQLAALSPLHREEALERLEVRYLEAPAPWDDARLRAALALTPAANCASLLRRVEPLPSQATLLETLRLCPDGRRVLEQRLTGAARFGELSALLDALGSDGEPGGDERAVVAHLLAGEPARAAAAARTWADHLAGHPHTEWTPESARCFALAALASTQPEALAALRARAEETAPDLDSFESELSMPAQYCGLLSWLAREQAGEAPPLEALPPRLYHDWMQVVVRGARGRWPTELRRARDFGGFPDRFGPTDPRRAQLFAAGWLDLALAHPPPLPEEPLGEVGAPPSEEAPEQADGGLRAESADYLRLREVAERAAPLAAFVALATSRANLHSALGDAAAARRTLQVTDPYLAPLEATLARLRAPQPTGFRVRDDETLEELLARRHAVAALVELRAGSPERAGPHLETLLRYPVAEPYASTVAPLAEPVLDDDALDAVMPTLNSEVRRRARVRVRASLADASALATGLREDPWRWAQITTPPHDSLGVSVVAEVLRRSPRGREAAGAALAEGWTPRPPLHANDAYYALVQHAQMRALAEAVGAEAVVTEVEASQRVIREATADPWTAQLLSIFLGI
ncbi:MAG TPA: hypothetical protein RMH99_01530 [Sandaracinaceae bacterium LLY-WYZ-13_1]|nr:hypothetical protein [Sandaracinaceae bacterium LLY-WYZ-13_1]